jgi:hypothetical protein
LVNGVPIAGTEFSASTEGADMRLQAHFAFEHFRPMAKRYPTFSSRYCSFNLELTEQQVDQLRKFLAIYSDLAVEVQKRNQPPPQSVDTAGVTL